MRAKELPSQAELNELFSYFPESGSLKWKHQKDRDAQWNGRFVGKEAGSVQKDRYRCVTINRSPFQAHRIIWMMAYGVVPEDMQIDHINGDGFDNRLSNLRLVTGQQNQMNRGADTGRKYKGVYKKGSSYKAEITAHGKRIYIGLFKTQTKAAIEYDKKAVELHGEHAKLNFPNNEGEAI